MQIQNTPTNYSGQEQMNSTNTNLSMGFSASSLNTHSISNWDATSCTNPFSSSSPNTQNVSNRDTPAYQKRLNDLEATCNSLQKQLQLLSNKQSGLTGSQENIQIVLNEVRDSLDPADQYNEEVNKQMNSLFWTKKDTTVGIPQQNNAFLTIPEISHTAQSSGDSGLGEFDLTALLDTSPFGSSNDIHKASKMYPNSAPDEAENANKDHAKNNSYKDNKASNLTTCNTGSVLDVVQEGQTPSQFQPDFMTDVYGFDMQL
jgi:hypothetical protein